MINPIRPTDDDARALAKTLIRAARSGALATLDADGRPAASLVSVATRPDGTPLILVSLLSGHTGNLARDPRSSLLLGRPGRGDPLAHPRITLHTAAREVARDTPEGAEARARFLAKNPKAELYVDFPDFSFFALEVDRASLNGGFGRAYELTREDVLTPIVGARGLVAAEAEAVAHMNADHAEAIGLYATRLLGEPEGAWRMTGCDPEGCDLALGDRVARLDFPEPVRDASGLRMVLVRLANEARARGTGAPGATTG